MISESRGGPPPNQFPELAADRVAVQLIPAGSSPAEQDQVLADQPFDPLGGGVAYDLAALVDPLPDQIGFVIREQRVLTHFRNVLRRIRPFSGSMSQR